MVAHGVEVDLHAVDGLDGGLVQKQGRHQRRSPHHVTGRHHRVVRIAGLERRNGAGQIGRATGRHGNSAVRPRHAHRQAGRLQMAVQVVETDQRDVDVLRRRCHGGTTRQGRQHAQGKGGAQAPAR